MLDSPLPETETSPRSKLPGTGNFGIALEPEVIKISGYALLVGVIGGLVAEGLLELIYFFTNVCFYGKFSFKITSPAHNHLGLWVILIPTLGGLLVGAMVYYLEPTLKGHGIPEAMEAVLFSHSRMRLRVAFLKPLATALAIGTGGPFGAEGPIIQTGAAFGSLFGQAVGLTPYYRRVLLAAGAAAGMAATFTAPLAGNSGGHRTTAFRISRSLLHSGRSRRSRRYRSSHPLRGMGASIPHGGLQTDRLQ